MKKFVKKLFACLAAFVMVFSLSVALTGCGKDPADPSTGAAKVMNLSLNPSIELVLDANDKVVSVNATNDEGNFIVANFDFSNKTANEAIQLFLQATKENGFVIEGDVSASNNQLKIEISGDNATALYNQVKQVAQNFFNQNNINASIDFTKINKSDLVNLVKDCMPDVEVSLLTSEEDLLAYIKASREETKAFFSQELKELYYESRAEEIFKAKVDAIKTYVNSVAQALLPESFDLAKFNEDIAGLPDAINNFANTYKENFIASTSSYQQALKHYVEKKNELLEARLNAAITDYTALETAVEEAYNDLCVDADSAYKLALAQVDSAKSTINSIKLAIEDTIDFFASFNQTLKSSIEQTVSQVKANFKQDFTTASSIFIAEAEALWDSLKPTVTE